MVIGDMMSIQVMHLLYIGNGHFHDAMANETTQGHCRILLALIWLRMLHLRSKVVCNNKHAFGNNITNHRMKG